MWLRWLELAVLYLVIPALVLLLVPSQDIWLMTILCLMGAFCLLVLLKDAHFKRFRLWHTDKFYHHIYQSLKLFVPAAVILTVVVYWFAPNVLFILPREQLGMWLMILVIYPVISVIPQELIFRTYFFHRYKNIIPSKNARWLLSTLLFAFAHMVYGNWLAVILSGIGGAIFGYRYLKTRSTLVVVVEHTLWGSYLFTLGLGSFLLAQ